MLWLGFFIALYGRPDPSAPYAPGEMGSLAWVPGGLAGLLFDQRFGLLPYAPVLASAFIGLGLMLVQRDSRRLALELLFVMGPYLLTVTHFAMWWAGWSAPARFFTPVLPLLAIPAAMFWVAVEHRRERPLALAALAFTVLASVVLVSVDRGRLAYNLRDTPALWLEWLSRTADLPQALPWWTRGGDAALFRDIAVWVLAFAATVGVMRFVHRSSVAKNGSSQAVAWVWALALAVMLASTAVWALRDADGRVTAAAQLHLLRTVASSSRAIGVELNRVRPIPVMAVTRRIRIERSRPIEAERAAGRDDRPLFEIPRVPAGVYRLQPVSESPRGRLMIGIGRDQFALFTLTIASPPQPIDLRFPIPVRGIVVRGDEEARQSVRGVVVEPVAVVANDEWRSQTSRRAVKYQGAAVFFLDDRSFPEPEGFWVRGSRSSSFVVQPESPRPVARLLLRNGPVANNATMTVARSATEIAFAPGEERYVNVPIDVSRGASIVTLAVAGSFRPSDHDPGSRDTRYLGIWVAVR
jgi:hypothetical protein